MEGFALVIVDMQKYYLESNSVYSEYFNSLFPGSLTYIRDRAYNIVIPNIIKIRKSFDIHKLPVVYLRLCGSNPDRSDLHRFFRKSYEDGVTAGFAGVYPLSSEIHADVIDELKPDAGDIIINKTTFSPFSSSDIDAVLRSINIKSLVFTGLATSQCVETTARDASERGYEVYQIHDAQTDYDDITHEASLFSSRGVCGGAIYDTETFLEIVMHSI